MFKHWKFKCSCWESWLTDKISWTYQVILGDCLNQWFLLHYAPHINCYQRYYWADFNQTWLRASLGEGDWNFTRKDHSVLKKMMFVLLSYSTLWYMYAYNLVLRKFIYWLELFLWMRLQNLRPCDCRCHEIETPQCSKAISAISDGLKFAALQWPFWCFHINLIFSKGEKHD